jgi:hypothetical protein
MPLDRQIFKILAAKTQARVVSNIEDANYIRRFFNTVQGVGCRIDAPRQDGKGWRIIVDGSSDIDFSGTGEPSIWTTLTRNTFPARITGTGASDGIYTFQELVPSGGLADTWDDRLSEEDTPALFRTGAAVEISGNAAIKIATLREEQKRVIMQESVEGYWWFYAPMCVALNQGTAFYAKFSSETEWTEHNPAGSAVTEPERTGTIGSGGSNTTEVNGNIKAEVNLVVLMTATGEDEYVYASPIPHLSQYEVVTALEHGKPEATFVRVSSE